jgi:hypothetical protein
MTYATIAWNVNWTIGLAKNPAMVEPIWSKISRVEPSGDGHRWCGPVTTSGAV